MSGVLQALMEEDLPLLMYMENNIQSSRMQYLNVYNRKVYHTEVYLHTCYCLQELTEAGCVERLASVLLNIETKVTVLVEVTAALAVMADDGMM